MTTLITASGQPVNLAMPHTSSIRIRDIAHHLALINRFCGATPLPYSVAQHSTVVARIVKQVSELAAWPLLALQALLHDAPEYVTGDITTPMQQALGRGREDYSSVDRAVLVAVHHSLGVPLPNEEAAKTIRYADRKAFATEWRDMMTGQCPVDHGLPATFPIKPIPWHAAEEKFLKEFDRLSMLAGIRAPKIPPSPAFAK